MNEQEIQHYGNDLENDEAEDHRTAEKLLHSNDCDALFSALEAEDIDSIRFCNEEMAFWNRIVRREKKTNKYLYVDNVNYYKDKIEVLHHDIIERRELKKEFSRV